LVGDTLEAIHNNATADREEERSETETVVGSEASRFEEDSDTMYSDKGGGGEGRGGAYGRNSRTRVSRPATLLLARMLTTWKRSSIPAFPLGGTLFPLERGRYMVLFSPLVPTAHLRATMRNMDMRTTDMSYLGYLFQNFEVQIWQMKVQIQSGEKEVAPKKEPALEKEAASKNEAASKEEAASKNGTALSLAKSTTKDVSCKI